MNPQLIMVQEFLELFARIDRIIGSLLEARDLARECVVELLLRMIEELLMPVVDDWRFA